MGVIANQMLVEALSKLHKKLKEKKAEKKTQTGKQK